MKFSKGQKVSFGNGIIGYIKKVNSDRTYNIGIADVILCENVNESDIRDYFNSERESIINDIVAELRHAKKQHPEFPEDIIHQCAIMSEEAGESIRAALNYKYEGGELYDYEIELIQTAAMCIRCLEAIR